ncbi:hypothetical protein C4D60_Mb02t19700 [Musa balbisiana]|uniref:Kinesin motor domain-containing protein n=1 Tax=Musa balbisiana TaxID=52838 RepID=A0A4S8IC08_MUSBA|nr:hypothetical protein C4D60_Mb02t19700 [Musa balbisiana]
MEQRAETAAGVAEGQRNTGARARFFGAKRREKAIAGCRGMEGTQNKGGMVPVSPSQTPRPTQKAGRDLRSVEGNGNSHSKYDKDKGVNVQVILRCRPLSEEELRMNTPVVISCNEHRREVSAVQNIANKQIDRTFVFDKVFGPASKQKDLFHQAISPIVNEVLEGYNCTIFAYGQTGTGKTYTMEGGGGRKTKNGEFPSDAGVIPRAVRQIFDILEAQCAEYSMKVTFLELYNEEITDLLAADDLKSSDDKSKKPIALMEDGKGGVFVRGLEEEVVYTASEIYKILDKGSAKRRTAETLLNKQSSRSHSIFSITIHIKECTPEGEEMIKCGKLNLVDLAGSENISRSGARDGRAREAGEINKSLLTLGRVINALVEHSGHVPYRWPKLPSSDIVFAEYHGRAREAGEINKSLLTLGRVINALVEHSGHVPYRDSKLTRLLRDSLGGKTKTCIIATISPSIHSLEETLSTLDYAHRAKNIKNKPESPHHDYQAMSEKIEHLEHDLDLKDKQLCGLQELYNSQQLLSAELSEKLKKTQKKLEDTEHAFFDLEERYRQANTKIKEKEFLIFSLLKSEKSLVEHAYELRSELENAAADIFGLFSKIERKDKIEDGNRILVQKFRSQLTQQLEILHKTVSASVMQQEAQLKEVEEDMQLFVSTKAEATKEIRGHVERLKEMYGSGIKALDDLAVELDKNSQSTFEILNSQVLMHSSTLEDVSRLYTYSALKELLLEADRLLHELQVSLSKQENKLVAFAQQQREDCTANEEKQLLEKVAEMLAISSTRKKKLVQAAVYSLRASAAERTSNLEHEMSTAHKFTSSVKEQWKSYMEETEDHYLEDIAAVENGKLRLDEGLRSCMEKAKLGSQQWRDAQNSLLNLDKVNVASVDSVVRSGLEANQLLRSRLFSAATTTLEDINVANKDLHSSIEYSLKLDHDACTNINCMLVPCCGELRELRSGHYHKIVKITENTGKCLEEEYMVDVPSCSTPRRRSIDLPSITSIEDLRTPAFEELLKSFWEAKSASKEANGDVSRSSEMQDPQLQDLRDARFALMAIN